MNDVSLREYIERVIQENNLRRDDLRDEDKRWISQELEAINKTLLLQATEYERRLKAWTLILSIVSVVVSILTVVAIYLKP